MSSKLNPVEKVTLSQGEVEVRQMPFVQALEFIKKLSALAGQMFDTEGRFVLAAKNGIDGPNGANVEINLGVLQDIVGSSSELTLFLIQHSTRKDAEWINSLSAAEGLVVLKKAIEMNLSQEILSLGNELAGFLADAFRRKPAATQKTPSLSASIS